MAEDSEKKLNLDFTTYTNVKIAIKNAKIKKYLRESEEINSTGLTFFGFFNKKNDLQLEKLKNVKLKLELLQLTNIEDNNKEYTAEDLMSELYACAILDLGGNFTPEMSRLYNGLKANIVIEDIEEFEEKMYVRAVSKMQDSKKYLPVVYAKKKFDVFGNINNQINLIREENKNIENQISIQRGISYDTQFK